MTLRLLLKRGALLVAANWPIVIVQFVSQATLKVVLAVPVFGAALLVAALIESDFGELVRGGLRQTFATVAATLMSEPAALVAFGAAFTIALVAGSVLTFLVKGGTVAILLAAEAETGPFEREPLTYESIRAGMRFTLEAFLAGCRRLFPRYLVLGVGLLLTYGASGTLYLAFIVYGYQLAGGRFLLIGWTLLAALATGVLVVWITLVNLLYLLLQIAIAAEETGVIGAVGAVARFVGTSRRELARVFGVVLALVVAATLVSALAWSGLGLIAFVPLVGLAVFPLQIGALMLRGLVFEYLGLTALTAYAALYHRHAEARREVAAAPAGSSGE